MTDEEALQVLKEALARGGQDREHVLGTARLLKALGTIQRPGPTDEVPHNNAFLRQYQKREQEEK